MKDFLKEINENDTQFYIVMDRFIKLYPKYKFEKDDYDEAWSILNDKCNQVDKDGHLLQNAIENENSKINSKIIELNKMIVNLETKNKILKQKLKYLNTTNNASDGLIDDTTQIYNENLYYLFILIICTSLIGYSLIKQVKIN